MESAQENQLPFNELVEQKKAEGWDYVGLDNLRETRFIDGLFEEVPVRTEEEIIERQRIRLTELVKESGSNADVEIQLIPKPGERFQELEIPDKFSTFYVFARVKK